MKNRIKIGLMFSMGLLAMDGLAETWSLDSCISYAINHNVGIRQQELRIKEGEQAITEAKDRFLPQLDASASESFSFGRGLTSDNTYANRNTSNFG